MIAKSYIYKNIKEINHLFNQANNHKKELYYSKLALLEVCGWIEESMDIIISELAKRKLKEITSLKKIQELIKNNYGFDYEKNFRNLLINVIGLINIEKLENNVDQIKHQKLKAALNNLKNARNKEAHTHLKGVTRSIDAPSVTMKHFLDVYEGLKEIELKLKSTRF